MGNLRTGILGCALRLPGFRGKVRMVDGLLRVLCPRDVITVRGIVRMEIDPREWLQRELLSGRIPEERTLGRIRALLRKGDVFVDVGAHVGLYSLFGSLGVGDSGRVVAIEPLPANVSQLLRNCEVNGMQNVVVYAGAAGNRNGILTLCDQRPEDRSRLCVRAPGVNDRAQRFVVPMFSMETILRRERLESVEAMKVDVEGFELDVLDGALRGGCEVRNIVLEICLDSADLIERNERVVDLLRERGYRLRTVDGNDWVVGAALPENNLWAERP